MNVGLSDRIRELATSNYVNPAIEAGHREFSIRVRDVWSDLQAEGFPRGNTPQICSALQTKKFLLDNGLEITRVEGPPKKVSPTVVVWYRLARPAALSATAERSGKTGMATMEETPEVRARRLTEKLRGLLKEELAEYGGADGFIRWVRGYDEEDAP